MFCWYLAVSDAGVPVGVGGEDAAQSTDAGVVLERLVFWHRTVKVTFDLIRRQRTQTHGLFHQIAVVTGVSHQLVVST